MRNNWMRNKFVSVLIVLVLGCSGNDRAPRVAAEKETELSSDIGEVTGAAAQDRSGGAADAAGGNDWCSFLGPWGDNTSTETGILTDWPAAGPPIVWHRPLGVSYGICTISDGRLFQFDRYGDQSRLSCLDSLTGELLWKFEYETSYRDMYGYNNGPRTSPVVDGDRVFILGAEGMLHCLTADKGGVVWKVDTAERFGVVQNFFGVGSNPVVEGDLLIANIGGSPAESHQIPPGRLDLVQGNGSGIVAFDKRTGDVRYQITDELASYAAPKLATINGRRWCFMFARGGLVGFDPSDGSVDFHYPWRAKKMESVNASTPVVVGNQVFISETYGPGSTLLEVAPGAHTVVWQDQLQARDKAMQTHWNTPIHRDGYLYGSSGRHSNNAELRCIEWNTGKVMWSVPGQTRSSLLYADGHFLSLAENGVLRLIRANPEKYDEIAQAVIRGNEADDGEADGGEADGGEADGGEVVPLISEPAWAAPILCNGMLYLRGNDRLVCLELIPQPGG